MIFSSCSYFYTKVGGNFKGQPEALNDNAPLNVKKLINKVISDLSGKPIIDIHAHVVGLGANASGAFVSQHMQTLKHPQKYIRFNVYKNAAGIKDDTNADQEYIERLVRLLKAFPYPVKVGILAFDKHYGIDGQVNLGLTEFYTPNEYMYSIYKKYPELFMPVISVHPYRDDAISELHKWAKLGVKYIKWLPNSMGIDPSNSKVIPYYEEVIKNNMIILSHVGEEKAVDGERFQKLGNPLLFKTALDMGVKIIMGHSASLGMGTDFEDINKKKVPNYELFLRLINNPKYKNNLWGDISTITQFNRYKNGLLKFINQFDIHDRFVNGSDYPLPAINMIIRTSDLEKEGYITKDEKEALNYIYSYNPLLFDFVLKRIIRDPIKKTQFSPEVFTNLPN